MRKTLSRKILPLTAAVVICGSPSYSGADDMETVSAESIFQYLSKKYNIAIEVLQNLRGNAFNDIGLRGIVNDSSYDLRDESFGTFLADKFGDEGGQLYGFLNQEGTEDFWISKDEVTGNIFVNRLIVSQDKVQTRSFQITNPGLGNAMSRFSMNINSAESLLDRIRDDKKEIEFEVAGGQELKDIDWNNVLKDPFNINASMADQEVLNFYDLSGIKEGLHNFLTIYDETVEGPLYKPFVNSPKNHIKAKYSVYGDKGKLVLSLIREAKIISQVATTHHNVPGKRDYRLKTAEDYRGAMGLEVVVAAAQDSLVVASADTATVKAPSGRGLGFVGEKKDLEKIKKKIPKPTVVDYLLGVGYNPVRGIAGMQLNLNDVVYGIYGGVSKLGDEHQSVSQSNVSALGNKHEVTRNWNEDGMGWFVGGDLGYRINKEFSVVVGADVGVDRIELSGKAVPRVYDKDGKVIGRNPDQIISNSNLRKRFGINAGVQHKGVSGRYSYDTYVKKHGVQVTVPVYRIFKGGRK